MKRGTVTNDFRIVLCANCGGETRYETSIKAPDPYMVGVRYPCCSLECARSWITQRRNERAS